MWEQAHHRRAPAHHHVTHVADQTLAGAGVEAHLLQALTHAPLQPTFTLYSVRPGDTVASIAQRFHDIAWLIRRRNGGLWDMAPGQQIRVWEWPFGTPHVAVQTYLTDRPQYYTVRAGDTLDAIASRLQADPATLAADNGLGASSVIYAGQVLILHHYTAHHERVLVPGVPPRLLSTGLLLADAANLVGADAALVKAVAWHETAWTMLRGRSGEIGMMQIMPFMARWVQRALVGYDLDPQTPLDNAMEGTLLLAYYLDVTGHDVHRTLALYHSGDMRPSRRNGLYIRAVLSLRDYFYHHPHAGT